MQVSMEDFVSPDFLLAFIFVLQQIALERVHERSRRLGLREIEFCKQSVKPLELGEVMSENFNEDDNTPGRKYSVN